MSDNTTLSIAVLSGKGGVGKSNLALNMSLALNQKGRKVLLIDCDLGLANLDVLLGITPSGDIQKLIDDDLDPADVLTPITADEINELLHIDFEACIPESMEGSKAYYTASYYAKDELTEIVANVKKIEVSITNPAWSPNSIAHGSDYYIESDDKRSEAFGVAVDAYVWPAHVQTNPETGFYREWDAYYLAFFEVDGFKYYVEGRDGVTEAEFSEFIGNVIEGYKAIP